MALVAVSARYRHHIIPPTALHNPGNASQCAALPCGRTPVAAGQLEASLAAAPQGDFGVALGGDPPAGVTYGTKPDAGTSPTIALAAGQGVAIACTGTGAARSTCAWPGRLESSGALALVRVSIDGQTTDVSTSSRSHMLLPARALDRGRRGALTGDGRSGPGRRHPARTAPRRI